MVLALVGAVLLAGSAAAVDLTAGMTKGTPDIKMAGPLAFGPDGILLIGDPQGAAIFAVATGDTKAGSGGTIKVEGIDAKIGAMLGTDAKGILINDLAVNPASGKAYLSVSRGKGPDAVGVLVRVASGGKLEEFPLKDVSFSKVTLPNPAGNRGRTQSITKIAFVKDRIFVAGLSNEEFASTLRSIPFPFRDADKGTGVEIWHTAHGRFETASPVRTFLAYSVNGEDNLLAAYTCTPLVKIPVSSLKPGERIRGTTVAELGNRNQPLDMIVYQKDGKEYILMANSARGVMKISLEGLEKSQGLTEPVRGGGKAGLSYETVADLKGVVQLDKLDKDHALILVNAPSGMNLETIAMP
jgi:hypothetical protein